MLTLLVKPGKQTTFKHKIRVLEAAIPKSAPWNANRLRLFADMIGAKSVGTMQYRDSFDTVYTIGEVS